MGRKTKNRSKQVHLAFKEGSTIQEYYVEIPFIYRLTMTPTEMGQTGEETKLFFVKPDSNLDGLIKEIENKYPYKIVNGEKHTERWTDLCPRCHLSGIPKIEMKDADDSRVRSEKDRQEAFTKKERPSEYWLTYTHKIAVEGKTKYKKCRIRQYENTPDPVYKQNKIPIERYFFPNILENIKNDSIWYAESKSNQSLQ
jgi:hypothetical protein